MVRRVALGGFGGVPLLAASVYLAPASAFFAPGRRIFPAVATTTATDAVGLTFDDGPGPSVDCFLRVLDEAGVRATFFVTGEQVADARSRVRDILSAGHEIGVHGYHHRNHLRLSPPQVTEDLRRARGTIEDAGEIKTTLFRPPYGLFNLATWREVRRQDWTPVLWSHWGRDWERRATPRSIVDRLGPPRTGSILLLHDSDRYAAPGSWERTLAALPLLFERVAAARLACKPVGALLG